MVWKFLQKLENDYSNNKVTISCYCHSLLFHAASRRHGDISAAVSFIKTSSPSKIGMFGSQTDLTPEEKQKICMEKVISRLKLGQTGTKVVEQLV
jgi:hypothetical protein